METITSAGESFDICTFFHSSWGVETYQGFSLNPIYLSEIRYQGGNINANSDIARKYITATIDPSDILITPRNFGLYNHNAVNLLKSKGHRIITHGTSQKITRDQLLRLIPNVDAVIAGTERYDIEVLKAANKLRVISRMGIGLDNIDFDVCEIPVAYTPDAPSDSVADLTVGMMLDLVRKFLYQVLNSIGVSGIDIVEDN